MNDLNEIMAKQITIIGYLNFLDKTLGELLFGGESTICSDFLISAKEDALNVLNWLAFGRTDEHYPEFVKPELLTEFERYYYEYRDRVVTEANTGGLPAAIAKYYELFSKFFIRDEPRRMTELYEIMAKQIAIICFLNSITKTFLELLYPNCNGESDYMNSISEKAFNVLHWLAFGKTAEHYDEFLSDELLEDFEENYGEYQDTLIEVANKEGLPAAIAKGYELFSKYFIQEETKA